MLTIKEIKYDAKKTPVCFQKAQKTFTKNQAPKINLDNCTKCHLCAAVCPHNSIEMKEAQTQERSQ